MLDRRQSAQRRRLADAPGPAAGARSVVAGAVVPRAGARDPHHGQARRVVRHRDADRRQALTAPGRDAAPQPVPGGWKIASDERPARVPALRRRRADAPQVGDLVGCGISHPCTTFDKWRVAVHRRRRLSRHRRDPHLLLTAIGRDPHDQAPHHAARPPWATCSLTMRERAAVAVAGAAAGRRGDARRIRNSRCAPTSTRWRAGPSVSPPTIIRFCRALGFAGLREFKLRLAQSLAVGTSTLHRAVAPGDNMQTVTHKVLQGAASALANLEQHIVPEDTRARRRADRQGAPRRLLRRRQHVDVHGQRRAGALLAARPRRRTAYFDAHLQLVSAATMNKRDVVARDFVRRPDAVPAARRSTLRKEQGATIVAITQPGTPLARAGRHRAAGRRSGRPVDARRHRGVSRADGLSRNPDGRRRLAPRRRRASASSSACARCCRSAASTARRIRCCRPA